ncbi:MAG: recombinase family protein, partial [Clostridia bacterium]|nr:recombinase family protein [Clostridia bacterium]
MQVDTAERDAVRIGLYERVSTDAQAEEGYSISIQKERLEAYVRSMAERPESIQHYTDDGYSGGNIHRPGLEQLILDVEAGQITHVIVYKLDRLSRSQKDTLHLIEDIFIPHNVSFI